MKKYILASVLVFGFLGFVGLANAIAPTTILSESFGSGGSINNIPDWDEKGTDSSDTTSAVQPTTGQNDEDKVSPDGGRFARIYSNEWICRTIDATGYTNLNLSYFWKEDKNANRNTGDLGIVEYRSGTGDCDPSFTQLGSHDLGPNNSGNNGSWKNWNTESLSFPSELSNTQFRLRFRNTANQNTEDFRVDGILITGTPITSDTTAPVLTLPANITQEATGPAGNTVSFSATATDTNPTNPVVTCGPSSGSTFPIGTTSVNCYATDTAGNTANGSFNIKIQDTTAPIISINGSSSVKVQVFSTYTELGAIASDLVDGNLSAIVGGDTVDTSVVGTYTVKYNKTDANGNIATEVTRTINVVDESAPSTTDNVPALWQNTNTTITFNCTDNVNCAKVYYTTDGTDPDTDSSFVDSSSNWQFTITTEGQYTIKYFSVDDSDNQEMIKTASNTLKINKTKPVITLLEDPEITIYVGMDYPFAGATAQDDIDGDITSKIVVDNQVNKMLVGSYEIAYNVTDTAGNKADEVIRKVNVVARRRTQTPTTTTTNTTENTRTNTEETPANTNTQGEVLGENTGNNTTENTNPVVTEEKPAGEVLGEATFKFTKFMKLGSRNEEVSELQKRLTQEGVYTGPITGFFGKLTDKAVREYQAKNPPLKVDGIVGPKTRAVLNGEN